jgi:hypothetical protein
MKRIKPMLLAWFCLTLTCKLSLAQFVPGPEQVLYAFQGAPNDGDLPGFGLIMDSSGNLYGTTQSGGSGSSNSGCNFVNPGCGTVFELSPNSKGAGRRPSSIIFRAAMTGQSHPLV